MSGKLKRNPEWGEWWAKVEAAAARAPELKWEEEEHRNCFCLAKLAAAEARVAELEADKRRLDWVQTIHGLNEYGKTYREEIDIRMVRAALREAKENEDVSGIHGSDD